MEFFLQTPSQAHRAISQLWHYAKPNIMAGRKLIVRVVDFEEDKTTQQRRYYHGYILTEIARQAKVNGQTFQMESWKEFFRNKYLGSKRIKIINPMTGKKSWRLERISTERLGVKGYNRLIEMVTAFGATELGVVFGETLESWSEENTV